MYDRILFPTDSPETTDRVLDHVVDLASKYDAELHVLYVVDTTVFVNDVETGVIVEEFESAGGRIAENAREKALETGLEAVTAEVAYGLPHRQILEYAADHGVNLIVMGTRGRTGLGRFLLGSVAERVVRLSPVPVLTVRRPESER